MKGAPSGYQDDVKEGPGGWAVWRERCPTCDERINSDDELPMALTCPTCEEPGCDECIPGGRGCQCSACEDAEFCSQ